MRDLKNKRNFSRLLQNQFFLHVKGFVCFVVKLLLFVVSGGAQGERLIAKCKLKRPCGAQVENLCYKRQDRIRGAQTGVCLAPVNMRRSVVFLYQNGRMVGWACGPRGDARSRLPVRVNTAWAVSPPYVLLKPAQGIGVSVLQKTGRRRGGRERLIAKCKMQISKCKLEENSKDPAGPALKIQFWERGKWPWPGPQGRNNGFEHLTCMRGGIFHG